ncbi:MAG TPA: thiamine-phosphate kinase [Hyphomicrobiales bacterium]|nr:thiamine-phosphate kinase [Hyphomicrobiales bacterium]
MSLSEFDIIARYFAQDGLAAVPGRDAGVVLGIGDDCALLSLPATEELALSMDVLVEGVHFPPKAPADEVARRALAVNLSDLAAMGATPVGFMLGLTLPAADPAWLEAFAAGLRESAQTYGCPLLGGNLTRGPLQMAIQVQGRVPAGCALRRDGARPGDLVYVSGALGAAGLALRQVLGTLQPDAALAAQLHQAYYRPQPRLGLGRALLGRASAAQDISDGLLADLGHLVRASGVGARLHAPRIPLAPPLLACLEPEEALMLALGAGEDYELVFTLPPLCASEVALLSEAAGVPLSCIGEVVPGAGVVVLDGAGRELHPPRQGFEHFTHAGEAP